MKTILFHKKSMPKTAKISKEEKLEWKHSQKDQKEEGVLL